MSSTYTDTKQLRWTNIHSQFGIFSHLRSNKACSNCLSHSNRANGWPYKLRSRNTTGSSNFSHDFGHLCRGKRIQTSGHSDLVIFTWVHADIASAACPSQPGNLAITSMIFCSSHLWRRRALFSGSRIGLNNVSSEHDSAFLLLQFWF